MIWQKPQRNQKPFLFKYITVSMLTGKGGLGLINIRMIIIFFKFSTAWIVSYLSVWKTCEKCFSAEIYRVLQTEPKCRHVFIINNNNIIILNILLFINRKWKKKTTSKETFSVNQMSSYGQLVWCSQEMIG